MDKSHAWWIFLPGGVYAYRWMFETPVSEREARAHARFILGLKRLPRGTQVWVG